MNDDSTADLDHAGMGSASDLLAGIGPHAPHGRATQFTTGFDPLDDVLHGGIRVQDLVLVGGRPGIGKTVIALQWARWIAMQGQTAIYVCYEHSPHTLLGRLLALELGSLARPDEAAELARLRPIAQEVALGASPVSALTTSPLGEEAYHRVQGYGARLHLVQGSGLRTGMVELARLVGEHRAGPTALFVDYLQKIPVPSAPHDVDARTTLLMERLKELAMVTEVAVVAVAATEKTGLRARRLHLHHLPRLGGARPRGGHRDPDERESRRGVEGAPRVRPRTGRAVQALGGPERREEPRGRAGYERGVPQGPGQLPVRPRRWLRGRIARGRAARAGVTES